ncbi:NADH-cytochrome b5 reductase [Chytriomyces hyalinus]|nr:NADH-cytochrome b5 reductase [Chytriomyces hyalinus]
MAITVRKFSNACYWITVVIITLFIALYLVFFRIVQDKVSNYPAPTAKIGFYSHASVGSLFFLSGLIQFNATLRHKYKTLHKICGYFYFTMSILVILSLIPLLIGGAETGISAWLFAILTGPLWLWANYLSYKAIINGDVTLHRRMNIRAFGFANSIIWMRPVVSILAAPWTVTSIDQVQPRIAEALKGGMWFTFLVEIMAVELFLYFEDNARAPLVTAAGIPFLTSQEKAALNLFDRNPFTSAKVSRVEMLNKSVLRIVFLLEGKAIITGPGEHISLRAKVNGKTTTRNYTPITTRSNMEAGLVELVIRLVPNGAMSSILQSSVTNDTTKELPAFQISHCLEGFDYQVNQHSLLLMAASGTGITPMINIARYILKNPVDKTRIHLIFSVRNADDAFLEDILKDLVQTATPSRFSFEIKYFLEGEVVTAESIRSYTINNESYRILLSGPERFLVPLEARLSALDKTVPVFSFGISDR